MKLIEYVTRSNHGDNGWYPGTESEDRSCAVSIQLTDVCGPDPTKGDIVNGVPAEPANYDIVAFATTARIDRLIPCAADDEIDWLTKEMNSDEVLDRVIGRAICTEHATGAMTWIGDAAVTVEDAAGGVPGAVASGRMTWTDGNSGTPALHSSADILPSLVTAGIVTEDGQKTVWGDDVVLSNGYLPATTFWSGPISVDIGKVQVDTWMDAPANKMAFNGTRMLAVDMSPCSVVRIGALPTDPAPIV